MRLKLKVVPGASRTGIAGWLGDALKVRVAVAPEKGRANRVVTALVARRLAISPDRVTIVSGDASPYKVLEIQGLGEREVRACLGDSDT